MAVLGTAGFVFGLLPHKFNHASMIGNSICGSYMLARGISIYIGYWWNEITILGMMKRGEAPQEPDPMFFAWFGAVVGLTLIFLPFQYYVIFKRLPYAKRFPYDCSKNWQVLHPMYHDYFEELHGGVNVAI